MHLQLLIAEQLATSKTCCAMLLWACTGRPSNAYALLTPSESRALLSVPVSHAAPTHCLKRRCDCAVPCSRQIKLFFFFLFFNQALRWP